MRKHLIGLRTATRDDIELVLDTAEACKQLFSRPVRKVPTLRGTMVVNLFYEPSTRTRTSFEMAGKWLSAEVVNMTVSSSSVAKGESIKDTARTILALGANIVVIRHSSPGAAHLLARTIDASIINAGDGTNEHPTQGLLDIYTIRERIGGLAGVRVLIVGDILHSRVARSNIWGLRTMGAQVAVCGPKTLIPPGLSELEVKEFDDLDDGLAWANVVNVLRIQLERQKSGLFPSRREYAQRYGITRQRLQLLPSDAVLMHPGPANLGVEITQEAALDSRSVISEQVTNGVAVRMAVLYLLSGGKSNEFVS